MQTTFKFLKIETLSNWDLVVDQELALLRCDLAFLTLTWARQVFVQTYSSVLEQTQLCLEYSK